MRKYTIAAKRIDENKPSRTIIKQVGKPNALFGGGLIHPIDNRHLGISELKRLDSIPDDFQMFGKFHEQWMRIGNSVPPLFMRSIARHVRSEILDKVQL